MYATIKLYSLIRTTTSIRIWQIRQPLWFLYSNLNLITVIYITNKQKVFKMQNIFGISWQELTGIVFQQ